MKLLVLCGSLRRESLNRKLAAAAAAAAGNGASVEATCLGEFPMPLYSGDLEDESGVPAGAEGLARRMAAVDGVIVVSPEYNRSIPGALKNALDWASRLDPDPFEGRPFLLLSASPGKYGGRRGLEHLRVVLEALGAKVHPETFPLSRADAVFDAAGRMVESAQARELERVVREFIAIN